MQVPTEARIGHLILWKQLREVVRGLKEVLGTKGRSPGSVAEPPLQLGCSVRQHRFELAFSYAFLGFIINAEKPSLVVTECTEPQG